MLTTQDRQSFSDISIIIKMMSPYMQSRINNKFIEFIEENKDKSYKSSIDITQPLENQTLSPNTKALLALIYKDYLCSDTERKEFISKQIQNQNKIEKEANEKYKINFNKTENVNTKAIENLNLITEYKKINIFTKLFNKIRKLFNFKK